jgi:hypothetical protein
VKKFVFLFHDQWEPVPEVQDAWQAWFARIGDRFIDSGTPFGAGVEVTRGGTRELTSADGVATGYSIVSAASLEEAEALLADCPYASSVRVYESMAM